jgi:hypothetical protein
MQNAIWEGFREREIGCSDGSCCECRVRKDVFRGLVEAVVTSTFLCEVFCLIVV